MPQHADWLTPNWPAPSNVHAVCTSRNGGVSVAPYESLNLGDHVGDDPVAVARNRELVVQAIEVPPVYMQQVHGRDVARLDAASRDGVQADGCVATAPGIACTIMVADCLPILFASDDGTIVGAAHAGWRGLAGGVVEAVVQALQVQPDHLLAWLGPCIGPEAFEVGDEVNAVFEIHDAAAARYFEPLREGKWLADLQGLARQRLAALGITRIYGNDGSREWCTVSNPPRFFSHRRDRVSGRFAAMIWRN
jgi:YfiH family protein